MRFAIVCFALAGCSSAAQGTSGDAGPPIDAGLPTGAGGSLLDQTGYPCGAVTTYPFDGGSLDGESFEAGDDGGLSYAQCQALCAGAPGGVRACSIGDGGTTLVCQAPDCG